MEVEVGMLGDKQGELRSAKLSADCGADSMPLPGTDAAVNRAYPDVLDRGRSGKA